MRHGTLYVLPTRVGMVRRTAPKRIAITGSPHPRGDGPICRDDAPWLDWFSPPAWGWSVIRTPTGWQVQVLPTRVGMVRDETDERAHARSSPHPRGDGPLDFRMLYNLFEFSPPAWGWSAYAETMADTALVLPTRVGMVRGADFLTVRC